MVIDFIVKLILGFIARAVNLTVAALDFNTQRVQPWLVLAQGNAPAHKSLLLDYPGLFGPFIPLTAFNRCAKDERPGTCLSHGNIDAFFFAEDIGMTTEHTAVYPNP